MDGIDAAEDWLDAWVGQANALAARSVELSRRVAALTGTAESRDGAIRVTVGSAGQVERLELDDRVHQLSGPRLAEEIMAVMRRAQSVLSGKVADEEIMAVMRRAQSVLSGKVADEVEATVGADTETGRAVIHSFDTRFPTAEPEEDR